MPVLVKCKPLCYLIISLVLFCFSCRKDNESLIPYVQVNITKNINNPDLINVKTIGGWAYLNGGSKGILVYRLSDDEIQAYDRHSPVNVEDGCVLEVEKNNFFVVDSCSMARFSIEDGLPVNELSRRAMVRYLTTFDGSILTIQN